MAEKDRTVISADGSGVHRLAPSEVPPAGTFGAVLRFKPPYPIRQKSAKGRPPARRFMRHCAVCQADFGLLAAGRSGEVGLWDSTSRWWCSQECYDLDHEEATPSVIRGRQ